jgi:hypothetical protein
MATCSHWNGCPGNYHVLCNGFHGSSHHALQWVGGRRWLKFVNAIDTSPITQHTLATGELRLLNLACNNAISALIDVSLANLDGHLAAFDSANNIEGYLPMLGSTICVCRRPVYVPDSDDEEDDEDDTVSTPDPASPADQDADMQSPSTSKVCLIFLFPFPISHLLFTYSI